MKLAHNVFILGAFVILSSIDSFAKYDIEVPQFEVSVKDFDNTPL